MGDFDRLLEDSSKVKENNPNNLKTFPLAKCRECGSTTDILVCEKHVRYFCRECLHAEALDEWGNKRFKVKCVNSITFNSCTYLPLVPKQEYAPTN